MALPGHRGDREFKKFVEDAAGNVAVRVVATDASGADMLKTEDSAHSSGDPGIQMLAVRNDTLAALAGTDGDYAPLQVNASGAVFVQTSGTGAGQFAEDSAHTTGDIGNQVLAVRNDTLAALAGTDGDYAPLQVSDVGALYTDVSEFAGNAVTLGAGAVAAGTLRVTLASDDPAVTALEIMDDWDETNRCAVNLIASQVGVAGGSGVNGATVQRVTIATDDTVATDLTSIKTAVELIDNSTAIDDSAQSATPAMLNVGGEYRASDTTYADGDATILQSDVNGHLKVRARGYDSGTDSNKTFEVNPISDHHTEQTVADVTNETNATVERFIDMDGVKYVGIHFEKDGGADSVTLTLEASIVDDGTAPATVSSNGDFIDVTNALTGAASYTADSMLLVDTPLPIKWLKIKTVSAGGANDADYRIFTKVLY